MKKILFILCLSFLLSGCTYPKPYHLTKMTYRGTVDKNGTTYDEVYTLHFTTDDHSGRQQSIDVTKETYEACTLEKNKEKDNGKN